MALIRYTDGENEIYDDHEERAREDMLSEREAEDRLCPWCRHVAEYCTCGGEE